MAFMHLSGSQTLVRDRPGEVQLAALVGSSPAEMAELKRRLEKCLVSELKEIARRWEGELSSLYSLQLLLESLQSRLLSAESDHLVVEGV